MNPVYLLSLLLFFCCWSKMDGQEVVLIRHAKVNMDAKGWIRARKAAEYREKYDVSPIHSFSATAVKKQLPVIISDTVYTSALARTQETAYLLWGDSVIYVALPLLNEYQLHVIRWPLWLPYKGWTSISRALWLMGLKKEGVESYSEAKERTLKVVDFIEHKSEGNPQVVLVTHGFLNRNIAKELEKRGWLRTLNKGKVNLGATVFKK
ncbi:phosphoglycerate mutase family protein [Saccharicrinis fermentans]|uniref:Alpha-ribazole phosphatase n=1 Tax=Saccharicrinis fermentans DSM 9555 = JCM 21142 TaxID=869213 RepID=W7Y4I9_9BACT|nr:phosphoglycerate mutase family protein [Saccharicrinis fermentans]GAF03017.1 alpha-ribazole phosphatase [Saccharicrinis fermentans DSM 9555 = JCM 21142]